MIFGEGNFFAEKKQKEDNIWRRKIYFCGEEKQGRKRMIICKRPAPPDDYLQEAGPSR